jgi:energy-coupling factor transporter ATP-binding protein EcfA2
VESNRVVRAVESATRSVNGNGLRFHASRWPRIVFGREFAASESDVRDGFPLGGHHNVGPDPPTTRVLALGRREDGRAVGPGVEPHQGRHLAVLGETGMGKSSLLTAICQSVAPTDGLILFDPFGDTARLVRSGLSGVAADRVRWIDPSAARGLNALSAVSEGPRAATGSGRRLNALVHALRRVRESRYADGGFWGPRLEEMLGRALRAAASLPGGTLLEAHALLAAEGRGFRTVPPESMEAVRALADRIRARPEDAEGARRLLFELARDADLVRLLCAREPSFEAAELVRPGEVVLLAGDASVVGESTARYLLSVFLALVWAELLARPAATKTWVVLDEAQWFAHEALAEMLRMARRCNVHVVLATQAVGSLPELVREALWTNVSDLVVFRGSPADAREIARSVRGASPESILCLPRGRALLLLGKGNSVERIRAARTILPCRGDRPRVGRALAEVGPPSGSPNTDPAGGDNDPGILPVVHALERLARDREPSEPLRVSLSRLRHEADPSGRWVREVGNRLARSGALLESGRDEQGSFWTVDVSKLDDDSGGWGELPRKDRPTRDFRPGTPESTPRNT